MPTSTGRGAGVSALALLAAWAEIPREPVVEYFLWLAQEGLEREPNQVWDSLVAGCADIEALVVLPALHRAYSDGLADPQFMSPEELARVESVPPGRMLEALREREPPIDDVAVATSWWSAFEKNSERDALEEDWTRRDRASNRNNRTERRRKSAGTNPVHAGAERNSRNAAEGDPRVPHTRWQTRSNPSGSTPQSSVLSRRVAAIAIGTPMPRPMNTSRPASDTICWTMSDGLAPIAIRTPISRRCSATRRASEPLSPIAANDSAGTFERR